ncbi:MAG TPA: 6-phosphogluconolactonase [Phycisphaerales bacterium]|nr:6-phosphogluconolactonase [Phycisphaerales bacterium]
MEDKPTYDLVGGNPPKLPSLPGGVVMRSDRDAVHDALLADIAVHARNCIRTFGDFQLAISFSPAIVPIVRRMMTDPLYREFPWSRTRVWLVDEVIVSEDDPQHRGSIMEGLVVEGSGMPREQAHRIDVSRPDAAAAYASTLREHLGWREKGQDRLDVVLVEQLADGSWSGVVDSQDTHELVVTTPVRSDAPARVCLSGAAVRSARLLAIIATGKQAAAGINHWRGSFSVRKSGVVPMIESAEVRWYVDYDACE